MNPAHFESEAYRLLSLIRVAFTIPGGVVAYEGRLNGEDVIVLGYHQGDGSEEGSFNAAPLAILMTDEVFAMLDVDGIKVGPGSAGAKQSG